MTDFEQIFAELARSKARFVVIGGVAVVLHGFPRLTLDLDLVVALDPDNALRTIHALQSLGYKPRAPVPAVDFADPVMRQRWIDEKGLLVFSLSSERFPLTAVDLFITEPFPFDAMLARATRIRVGVTEVPVASVEDLITMKEQAARPKDLLDIDALRRLSSGGTER